MSILHALTDKVCFMYQQCWIFSTVLFIQCYLLHNLYSWINLTEIIISPSRHSWTLHIAGSLVCCTFYDMGILSCGRLRGPMTLIPVAMATDLSRSKGKWQLLNVRQQVWESGCESRVLRDDHYKRMSRFTSNYLLLNGHDCRV